MPSCDGRNGICGLANDWNPWLSALGATSFQECNKDKCLDSITPLDGRLYDYLQSKASLTDLESVRIVAFNS